MFEILSHFWPKKGMSLRGVTSMQETIEKSLATVLHEKVSLIGASRTDAGVHARGQIANLVKMTY